MLMAPSKAYYGCGCKLVACMDMLFANRSLDAVASETMLEYGRMAYDQWLARHK